MKKILLVVFLVYGLFPLSSIRAEPPSVDILPTATYTSEVTGGSISRIPAITDGDLSTSATMINTQYVFFMATIKYKFDKPYTIDAYQIRVAESTDGNLGFNYFTADEPDKRKVLSLVKSGDKITFPQPLENVIGIEMIGSKAYQNTRASINIYDAKFFGKIDKNPDSEKFAISNLSYKAASATSGMLEWDAVESIYLTHYKVYKNDQYLGRSSGNNYYITSLEPGETYVFNVSAVDIFDHEFAPASTRYTVPVPDTTPPDVPKILKVLPETTTAEVTWQRSAAADTAGYTLYLNGKKVGDKLISGSVYMLSGLKMDQEYQVYITAQDTTGNVSEPSETVKFRTKKAVTDSEQEETPEFLLVKWEPTDGAISYNIYLNGRKVGSVGPNVFEFKITKAMGYRPGALENRAEVKAVFEDGTEGDGSGPGGSIIKSPLNVVDVIKAGFGFLGLFDSWVLLMLAVIFAAIIISYLFHIVKRKPSKPVRRG